MGLAAVQLDVNLVPGVQMEDDAVGGVVVVLVRVLGYGAGTNLEATGTDEHVGDGGRLVSHRTFFRPLLMQLT